MRRVLAVVAVLTVAAFAGPRGSGWFREPTETVERPFSGGAVPAPVAPTGVGDVTGLTPAMKRSIARAIAAAAADGIELRVTSGWRSAEHQQRLYEDAIEKYGSPRLARRWVLPPSESAHVRGEAVDVGPAAAAAWLDRHGVRFGLCRRYANEPWHFERLAGAKGSRCPALEPHP